jgi:hypothetical protein
MNLTSTDSIHTTVYLAPSTHWYCGQPTYWAVGPDGVQPIDPDTYARHEGCKVRKSRLSPILRGGTPPFICVNCADNLELERLDRAPGYLVIRCNFCGNEGWFSYSELGALH